MTGTKFDVLNFYVLKCKFSSRNLVKGFRLSLAKIGRIGQRLAKKWLKHLLKLAVWGRFSFLTVKAQRIYA